MKILIVFILFLPLSSLGETEPVRTYSEGELSTKTGALVLLSSSPYACDQNDQQKLCEKNAVYEKDLGKIHLMLVDGRNGESGELNINELMRAPASYGGAIKTFDLKEIFGEDKVIETVMTTLTKDNKIKIKIIHKTGTEEEILPQ